jgi:hypothetical protein
MTHLNYQTNEKTDFSKNKYSQFNRSITIKVNDIHCILRIIEVAQNTHPFIGRDKHLHPRIRLTQGKLISNREKNSKFIASINTKEHQILEVGEPVKSKEKVCLWITYVTGTLIDNNTFNSGDIVQFFKFFDKTI